MSDTVNRNVYNIYPIWKPLPTDLPLRSVIVNTRLCAYLEINKGGGCFGGFKGWHRLCDYVREPDACPHTLNLAKCSVLFYCIAESWQVAVVVGGRWTLI